MDKREIEDPGEIVEDDEEEHGLGALMPDDVDPDEDMRRYLAIKDPFNMDNRPID